VASEGSILGQGVGIVLSRYSLMRYLLISDANSDVSNLKL
jgi:hypothetical protein